jgi:hypothetical protein
MGSLFFFLNQSKHEHSLVFAKILPPYFLDSNLNNRYIVIHDVLDTSKIIPNIDPNLLIYDTTKIDTSKNIASAYSLRSFAPPVLSQGELGSCVSWATAYAGLTIVKGIELNQKIDPYSPLNLYIRYKLLMNESPCSYGASVPYALNILKNNGCLKFNTFKNSCDANVSKDEEYSDKLFSYSVIDPNHINKIKSAISSKMPVSIAIKCYSGDSWHNAKLNNGLWSGYASGIVNGGHAMCLIGYDDSKEGGAFEIMNSWGEDWGDKGFFWIKYNDFPKFVDECYAMMSIKTLSQ